MQYTARTYRLARFSRAFSLWLAAVALLVTLGTGVAVYIVAPDSDLATARDSYWGVVKWYVWDIHAVFGLLMLVAAGSGAALWKAAPPGKINGARSPVRRALPLVAALGAGWLVSQWVIDAHPVFMHTIRATDHPVQAAPGQVTLTRAEDARTQQVVQWRSSPGLANHTARFRPADSPGVSWRTVAAATDAIVDPYLANDGPLAWHTAVLNGLAPGTPYVYQVRSGDIWSDPARFVTEAAAPAPFSFAYLGDVQRGFPTWGRLLTAAHARQPAMAFVIVGGDLVDDGVERDQWDAFLHEGAPVLASVPIAPAIGNHDDDEDGNPWMYLQYFDLPDNGPETLEAERAYHFTHGDALFVVLDSNLPPETQTGWLERVLADSEARWKIVVAHHPLYASKPHRDNPELREAWLPAFYEHGVNLVLQGHDHAYMRTHPMRGGVPVDDPAQGTTFVVAVAGTKFYEQEDRDYMATAYPERPTYQLIDIDGATLRYRAYDLDDALIDEFTITQ